VFSVFFGGNIRNTLPLQRPLEILFAVGKLGLMPSEVMKAAALAESAANDNQPPEGITPEAKALWFARAGKWDAAHDLCQDIPGKTGFWIHAWLHREEGDLGNAGYWYSKAGREMPAQSVSLEDEWMGIATELLD